MSQSGRLLPEARGTILPIQIKRQLTPKPAIAAIPSPIRFLLRTAMNPAFREFTLHFAYIADLQGKCEFSAILRQETGD